MKRIKKIAYCMAVVTVVALGIGCRNNEEPERNIEGLKFEVSLRSLYVGDITTIAMSVMPAEVKNKEKVMYSVSKPGIVDIKEGSSNDGVIIEAKSKGSVVITGRVAGFVDYCNITVEGGEIFTIPHIITPVSVLQVPVRERRSVTVSLAGGTPIDNSGFIWTYTNQNVISFESTGNVCVFDTLETGSMVITVRHPKAQYSVDILVFILGSGETPIYITSVNNVINLNKNINNYEFQMELIGGTAEDNGRFVYQVVEGKDLIQINGNGKYGTIRPVASGFAVVRVTHPKAQYPYDIHVLINETPDYHYIEVNKTLVLLQEGENTVVEANFNGDAPGDILNKYDFILSENGVAEVSRSQGLFFINAVRKGMTILSVSNEYADFNREILIVVTNALEGVIDNQKYIYTNQNVITMEEGGKDAVLRMILVGGNSADKNGFVWIVDDSSVIEAKTGHGEIKNRLMLRSLYEGLSYEQFEAQALLSPKKAGTAKITLSHPKSRNEATVLVKVYPKKTFESVPVVLGGKPYYKVERGKSFEIGLVVDSGDPSDVGDLKWSVDKGTVAEVESAGLTGVVKGLSNGITTLTVEGGNLKQPFNAVIIVNSESDINKQKFIYVYNPFVTLTAGQTMTMGIFGENISDDEMRSINYINSDSTVVQITSARNQLGLTGLKQGKSDILVKGNDTNEIKIVVTVEDIRVNTDQPFYLTSIKDIIGVVKNQTEDIEVSLVGGSSARYESGIIWSVENNTIAGVTGNGKKARITGITDGQTVINVSHPKSANALRIVLFVVKDPDDLNNKIVLFAEKTSYLLEKYERVYIPLLSSAKDYQKAGIQWSVDNPDIIEYVISADNMAVFITGLQAGVARISVTHSQNVIPQVIYVSIVSKKQGLKYINVPSIVETVAGNNLMIQAATQNLESSEIENITWRVDNENIAYIAGNGEKCVLQARMNGSAAITVEQRNIGFEKNIVAYIYSSYEEMAASYVMGAEQSFYRINKGDVIDVILMFGAKGFPEHEINNIRWSAGGNNVVSVAGNGKKASIRALNTGIAQLYAESDLAKNRKVFIEIEVIDSEKVNSGYHFDISARDRIKGIENGKYADILVKLFNGTTEIMSGLNKMEFEAEDAGVISLTVIDNNVRVTAKKTGRSYITIRHPSVAENERILIYTADSQSALDDVYPLSFDKNNYLLKKGSIVRIKAETIDNDEMKLNKINFETEGRGIISIAEISRREISVSALEKGNDVILVKYNNEIVQRIYVSVTLTVDSDLAAYLVTESIIGMVAGNTYETKVNTNLPGYMASTLNWRSDDSETVSVESYEGVKAVLRAHKTGKTYITVKTGNIERKILVFTCSTENELRNYQAINIDQRYFVINKGQSMSLNMFSYQGKTQGITQYEDYYNSSGDFGNVIELSNKTAGSVTVNGKQEGIAGIRIINSFYNTEIVVYVEVQNNGTGGTGGFSSGNYITSRHTLVIIEPNEKNVTVNVDVVGSNFFQYGSFSWEGYDSSVIEVKASGNEAILNPVKKGQTVITVRNVYCDNELQIMVIVGSRYSVENTDEPYLYVEKTVYDISINDSAFIVYYEVRNYDNYDYKNISFNIDGSSVSVSTGNPGRLTVTPMYGGLTTVRIKAFNNIAVDVYFIVREKELGDIVYLTTVDNYVIGSINEIKYADIRLVGYEEIDSNQFKWSIDKLQVAQVMGNGTRGQIYPVGEGDAVITVTHHKARFPLTINVRITKNAVANQLVYLTTPANVIEGLVGEENYVYVRKIGGRENINGCTWAVDDPTIVSVSGNEYTGTYKIKKAGVARINVTNAESAFPLQIVVVAKEKTGSPSFIVSSDTLLSMVPGEINRRVSVNLAGGGETDNIRFHWSVYYQNPVDIKIAKNNGNVVTLTTNANQCNITAVNEGVARIRVAHEKADNPLYITVQVSKYRQIEFPFNEKQIMAGESEFIRINVPNYENFKEKLFFVSDNPAVCTMVGTSSTALLTAHSKGYAIVKAKIEGMDQEAELYVNVVETEGPDTNRIVVGKTSYSFNPRSGPEKIRAALNGLNINDSDQDNIWWELVSFDDYKEPVLDIYPSAATNKELGSREIQISPRREGEAQIVIGHRFVHPKYYKTINILVSETSNALTLDKNLITLGDKTQTLTATITGAKQKDYDEIIWEAEKILMFDGTRKEVVRIMGYGQNVTLMPMSDGTVEVMARYKGFRASCMVTVQSQYFFSVQIQSMRLYPGEVVDVNYDVRPADSIISWYAINNGSYDDPVIRWDNIESQKMLRLTGLREGSVQIMGTANGKMATINVYVRWNYSLNADAYLEIKPVVLPADKPGIIKYKVNPPIMRIEAQVPDEIKDDIILEIINPVFIEKGFPAEGIIYITTKREIPTTAITWLLKKSSDEIIPNVVSQTFIKSYFSPKENITPYFVRNFGVWSNSKYEGVAVPIYGKYIKNNVEMGENLKGRDNVYDLEIGDGEEHYIVFDKLYENSSITWANLDTSQVMQLNEEGVKAELLDIVHNGNTVKALRISGGKDEIDYNRVMFNKNLYIDVETQYYQYSNGQTASTETQEQSLWADSFDIPWIIGYMEETLNLWDSWGKFQIGKDIWYFYTEEEYEMITGLYHNEDNFILRENVPNNQLIVLPQMLKYGSRTNVFYITDKIQYFGHEYIIPIMKDGYFYAQQVVNQYSEVFKPYTPLELVIPLLEGFVFEEKISYTHDKPVYDNKTLYVYQLEMLEKIDNFERIEDIDEDQYGNKDIMAKNIPLYINKIDATKVDLKNCAISFVPYNDTLIIIKPLSPTISSWNVFNPVNKRMWSNNWNIQPNIYYESNNHNGNQPKSGVYFEYAGLRDSGKVFFLGDTGNNRYSANLFNGNNVWSPAYYKQELQHYHREASYDFWRVPKQIDGYCYSKVVNKSVNARNRYRWEYSDYNIIIPIERMLQFPLYVNYPSYGVNDYISVPFREMYSGDRRLSEAGVTSTPMPSIDTTTLIISPTVILNVKYRTYDKTIESITFNIIKKTRVCHARYNGSAGDPNAVNIMNGSNVVEMQGITEWDRLEPKYDIPGIGKHNVYVEKKIEADT